MTRRLACLLLATLLAGLAAVAYPADNDYMRLARLSYIEGHVSLQYASDVEWSAASVNMPLEPGDRIYTGRDGRAEIEFDEGSVYRLAEDTDIEILSLNENLIQVRILVGLSSLTVSSGLDFEIDTPAAAFDTIRKGAYRFEVNENGETAAIVRTGELEAANNEFVRRIQTGERLSVRAGGSTELARYNGRDAWDEWNDRRNANMWAQTSREYLPDTVYIGISDLDRHGRWVQVETYGTAWVPFSVDVSWSPYSVGRWTYRPFYGWTWVSYEPWGWLPYHYGRWYRSAGFGWCWLPGPAFSFNFWSPGLVAFYSDPGWVSWCPLGPGDYYNINHYYYNRRIYGYQLDRLRSLHIRAQGRPFYRNDRGAFRTVPLDQFRNGSLHGNAVATRRGYVNLASRKDAFVKDRLNIKPTSASYSANPGRPTSKPKRTSALPAVVRSDPGVKTKNRGGFTRVTNPQATASRVARNRSEANARGGSRETDPSVRVVQFGSEQGTNQGVRSQSGNNSAEASGRRTATSGYSRDSANSSGASANREGTGGVARVRNNTSSDSQGRSNGGTNRAAPERNGSAPSSPQARPRVEQRQPATSSAPSSSAIRRQNSNSSSTARAPVTGRTRTYSAPRQSSPSPQRNSAVRSPSSVRSSQPSVRSGGRASSGSSGGQAQKRSNSGSSGGARRR